MALNSLRLWRALTSLSSSRRTISSVSAVSSPAPLRSSIRSSAPAASALLLLQFRTLKSSSVSLSASQPLGRPDGELGPNDILFEGCDYKHWLFVIDFPEYPKIFPEEMVARYEEICAEGLNISIEEARSKIYACSTTTYQGFQAVMSEEEAEKFHKIPRVVFVLPDSYLYPETKEYGGDKYINGEIIPRPPPAKYQKRPPQRPHDRDARRVPDRQYKANYNDQGDGRNYVQMGQVDRRGPTPNYGPSQDYGSHGQVDRNGPVQNYRPQQDYGTPGHGDGRAPMPNYRPSQDYGPPGHGDGRAPMPNYRPSQDYGLPGQGEWIGPVLNRGLPQNYGQPGHGDGRGPMPNCRPPQNYGQPGQGERVGPVSNHGAPQNYSQPGQGGRVGPAPNHGAPQNYGQPGHRERVGPVPNHGAPQNYGQPGHGERVGPVPNHGAPQNYGQPGHGERVGPVPNRGAPQNYGQPGQREGRDAVPPYRGPYNQQQQGNYPQPSGQGQEIDGAQASKEYEDGQRFSLVVEQEDLQGQHVNHTPKGQTGANQERY